MTHWHPRPLTPLIKRMNWIEEQGHTFPRDNLVDIPDVAMVHWVVISINFLLFERPARELVTVAPERYPHWDMYKLEVTALAPDGFTFVHAIQGKLEERVIITGRVILRPGREFLVGRHKRRQGFQALQMSDPSGGTNPASNVAT
jgi:hypothetical protein